jgi:hypothetical protein
LAIHTISPLLTLKFKQLSRWRPRKLITYHKSANVRSMSSLAPRKVERTSSNTTVLANNSNLKHVNDDRPVKRTKTAHQAATPDLDEESSLPSAGTHSIRCRSAKTSVEFHTDAQSTSDSADIIANYWSTQGQCANFGIRLLLRFLRWGLLGYP